MTKRATWKTFKIYIGYAFISVDKKIKFLRKPGMCTGVQGQMLIQLFVFRQIVSGRIGFFTRFAKTCPRKRTFLLKFVRSSKI